MNDTKRRRAARLLSMVLAALFGALPAGAQTTDFCGCAGSPSLGAFVSGDAATHPPGTVRNPSWINSYDHGIRIPLPPDGILVFDSFTVQYYPGFGAGWNTHVFFEPNAANTPVTLLVKGNVTIADAGRLRVSGWSGGAGSAGTAGRPGAGGPGGFAGGQGAYQLVNFANRVATASDRAEASGRPSIRSRSPPAAPSSACPSCGRSSAARAAAGAARSTARPARPGAAAGAAGARS